MPETAASMQSFTRSDFTLLYFSFTGIIGEIPTSQINPSLKFWQSKQYRQRQHACCITHTHSNEPPSILCFSQSAFTLLYFSFTGIIGEIPTSQIHPSLKFWQSKQYQQWQRACCITHTKEPPSTSCASHNQILPYFTSPSLESSESFPQVRFIPHSSSSNPNNIGNGNVHVASHTLK